jgi:tetratricopeptide (TPR) repeat protein
VNLDLNELLQQGIIDYTEKRFNDAELKFKTILDHAPDNQIIWHNYGLALIQQDKFIEGINALNVPVKHGYTESLLSRGAAYRSLGRYQEAMSDFAQCLVNDPDNVNAHSNLGNSFREFGLPQVAMPFFEKALQHDPTNPTYKLNESVAHLLNGDLINGWKNYDARWFYQSDKSFKPNLPGTEYNGTQDINDKIVCVYCEQGFGDSIQFIRYVRLLQDKGASILLVTREPLVDLFKYNYPEIDIRTGYDNLSYHYHVPLMELPKCFNTSIDTIPSPEPYLDIDQKFNVTKTKKRIGVVWSSNAVAFITRFRQVPLEPLLQTLSDYEIVNLEFDVSDEEKLILDKYNVMSYQVDGFDETASLMKTLDLVVTVDTVYAHLAGALGIPTYVMLADYGMDWRWFLKRTDSPFYNSVKLFRQHGDSDWNKVFNDIKIELDK